MSSFERVSQDSLCAASSVTFYNDCTDSYPRRNERRFRRKIENSTRDVCGTSVSTIFGVGFDDADCDGSRQRRRRRSNKRTPCVTMAAASALCLAAALSSSSFHADAFSAPLSTAGYRLSMKAGGLGGGALPIRKMSGKRLSATAAPVAPVSQTAPPVPRRRKKNVFDQFTPAYDSSPFDVSFGSEADHFEVNSNGEKKTKLSQKRKQRQNKSEGEVHRRIAALLADDVGEQNPSVPDDSPEAAHEIADGASSRKVSEEARRKANVAVSTAGEAEEDFSAAKVRRVVAGESDHSVAPRHSQEDYDADQEPMPRRRRGPQKILRATVKETGSDSISTYIKSLGQHELLYKEDEVALGRQVRILTTLEKERQNLEEELLMPPTYAQWAAVAKTTVPQLKQQIRRSQRAKAALIEANLRLVVTVARQSVKKGGSGGAGGGVQFQDACQQGIIGLARAAEKFDPELGFRFSTYAVWWIQKEVAKNVSEQTRTVRLPGSAIRKINDIRINERLLMTELGRKPRDEELAEKCGLNVEKLNFYRRSANEVSSIDRQIEARKGKGSAASGSGGNDGNTMQNFIRDTELPSPTEIVDQQMMKEDIRRLVKTLDPREQAVIRMRFGLDDGKPKSLTEIGDTFGVDKERIKKIEAKALLKLRQPYRNQVVKCYVSDHT